jgi:hypothetical protein
VRTETRKKERKPKGNHHENLQEKSDGIRRENHRETEGKQERNRNRNRETKMGRREVKKRKREREREKRKKVVIWEEG